MDVRDGMRDPGRYRHPVLTLLGIGALLLGGCAGGASVGQGPSETTPMATADATPTAAGTTRPTPTPDPATQLAERLRFEPDRIDARFRGTMAVVKEVVPVTGRYTGEGPDFHVKLKYSGSEMTGSSEQIHRGGANFVRSDAGSWTRSDDEPNDRPTGVMRLLSNATVFRSLGQAADQPFTRFDAVGVDMSALARQLGLLDRTSELAGGSVEVLVGSRGDPVGMVVAAEITQALGETSVATTWELEYTFLPVTGAIEIDAPDEAWRVHADPEIGYLVLYPHEWTFSEETDGDYVFHLFVGPAGREVQVHWYTEMAGTTADGWFRESADLLARDFGAQPHEESITIAGLPARLLTLEVVDHGRPYLFQQAVVYGEAVAFDINSWSPRPSEDADRELFAKLLSTFVPLR